MATDSDIQDLREAAGETIYLVPMSIDGGLRYAWCDDPAPGEGMDASEAVEYVRRDKYDALAAHVEHITERARLVTDRRNWEGNADPRVPHVLLDKLSDACQAKRDASLARRDARVVADALEPLLKLARSGGGSAYMIETIETNIDQLRHRAGDIRRQAEGGDA